MLSYSYFLNSGVDLWTFRIKLMGQYQIDDVPILILQLCCSAYRITLNKLYHYFY